MSHEKYKECIEACQACAAECEHCADACLSEQDVAKMADCIRLDRDCADFCSLAVRLMARGSAYAREFCETCARVCDACAAECDKHESEHCKACAEACRRCADACRRMAAMPAAA